MWELIINPYVAILSAVIAIIFGCWIIVTRDRKKKKRQDEQYEYQKVYLGERLDVSLKYGPDFLVKRLNELGQEGWRLAVYQDDGESVEALFCRIKQ